MATKEEAQQVWRGNNAFRTGQVLAMERQLSDIDRQTMEVLMTSRSKNLHSQGSSSQVLDSKVSITWSCAQWLISEKFSTYCGNSFCMRRALFVTGQDTGRQVGTARSWIAHDSFFSCTCPTSGICWPGKSLLLPCKHGHAFKNLYASGYVMLASGCCKACSALGDLPPE